MMLHPVPLGKLGEHWGYVRNGLIHCIEKTQERWIPEDVYVAIKAGNSHLFLIGDFGFCILQQHNDADGSVLFVWALWCEPGEGGKREPEIMAALEKKAREIGAVRIRMESPRKGWTRSKFWSVKSVNYEHEV